MVVVKIYTITNPITNLVFYVGRCVGKPESRLKCHIIECTATYCRKGRKTAILSEIINSGLYPKIEIIDEVVCYTESDEIMANKMEAYWIGQLREWGFKLVNGPALLKKYNTKPLINWDKALGKNN